MPDNHIVSETSSGTKQFFFDSNTSVAGLFLALTSVGACVTVSRVLVYHYECPGHDRLSTGLERRPATQAPVNGSVSVTPYCAENSHFTDISAPHHLVCTSKGTWENDLTHCECNTGYSKDEDGPKCEGIIIQNGTTVCVMFCVCCVHISPPQSSNKECNFPPLSSKWDVAPNYCNNVHHCISASRDNQW